MALDLQQFAVDVTRRVNDHPDAAQKEIEAALTTAHMDGLVDGRRITRSEKLIYGLAGIVILLLLVANSYFISLAATLVPR